VRAGSLALARAAHYLAPGVVVAVVDPGVGTARRAVAVRAAHGAPVFVGPDNGLLLPALDRLGGGVLAVELRPTRPGEGGAAGMAGGPTFDGRDLFAPAAARLAGGEALTELGPTIAADGLVRLPAPRCQALADGGTEVEVTWVDRYGNVQLSATAADLPLGRGTVRVENGPEGDRRRPLGTARRVTAFADLAPDELGLLTDSDGHLALCTYRASAAQRLGVDETDVLVLRDATAGGRDG
jgi:S-adenosylmethionine hydrolase